MRKNHFTIEDNAEINVSPLLDMVFILLIFFVVTSTFTKDTGVDVKKPKADSAQEIKDKSLKIAITKEGSVYINQKQVDFDILESILKRQKNRFPNIKAVIVADSSSITETLIKVIDKCNLAGIKDVSLAALQE